VRAEVYKSNDVALGSARGIQSYSAIGEEERGHETGSEGCNRTRAQPELAGAKEKADQVGYPQLLSGILKQLTQIGQAVIGHTPFSDN
jgi:hypothetical protein